MNSFWISFNAVLPFILYLAFGYGVRRSGMADLPFLRKMNRMAFRAFYPLLMFCNMYTIGDSFPLSMKFLAISVASMFIIIGASCALVPKFIKDPRQIPVIIQGLYRSNILLFAVPLVQNLFGDTEMVKAAALVIIVVPIYNVSGGAGGRGDGKAEYGHQDHRRGNSDRRGSGLYCGDRLPRRGGDEARTYPGTRDL